MKALICVIHGIDSTNEGWVDDFRDFCAVADPELSLLPSEYVAGPFPIWNNWFQDPAVAKDLAEQISYNSAKEPVYFVMHSNGNVIGNSTAQLLIKSGRKVAGAIYIAGAIDADVNKNGILSKVKANTLGFAVAYCSPNDEVLAGDPSLETGWWNKVKSWVWGKLMSPYGYLGVSGWLSGSIPFTLPGKIFVRWFNGGHSGYFTNEQKSSTFQQILQDIKSLPSNG